MKSATLSLSLSIVARPRARARAGERPPELGVAGEPWTATASAAGSPGGTSRPASPRRAVPDPADVRGDDRQPDPIAS